MDFKDIVNEQEIRKTVNVLKPDHQLFEVRILGADKRNVLSGYFTDCDVLIDALRHAPLSGTNIYITLNKVNEALYSRIQKDRFVKNVNTTTDTEIDRYEWLFIDLDPIRPANISSSDKELQMAADLMGKVKDYMHGLGFMDPVEAASGNGYHLLYRIDLPVSLPHKQLLENCLSVLADLFNNADVKIDTVNFNPARICKLHGTLAQKGANTANRPHRMSKLLCVPDPVQITGIEILEKLKNELPKPEPAQRVSLTRKINPTFNARQWIDEHGLTYRETQGDRGPILLLDECPFDHSHRNGDAKIFLYDNGAVEFKCHHNSCREYHWKQLRMKLEPTAYEQEDNYARIEDGYKKHKKDKQAVVEIPLEGETVKKEEPKKKFEIRKLKTARSLMAKDLPDPKVFIGVGDELPILVEGTCILSAKAKLGKSWFALALCLAVANGEDFLGYKTEKCSALYLDLETSEVIQKRRLAKILKGKPVPENFYLETATNAINNGFLDQLEAYIKQDPKIGVIVVDVFAIIRSPAKSIKESEYDHAYRDITPLNKFAQDHHVSIILVCHDRKNVDQDDPFANILGSTGLQGAATQMIVMFRKRKDDPIHVSVKGKTIDGLPELNVKIQEAEWSVVEATSRASREDAEAEEEYQQSIVRNAVSVIAEKEASWKGRCSQLISAAIDYGVAITDNPKTVGGFLHRHRGRFLRDGIQITIIENGTGPKIYKICKSTIDTIDENEELPLMDYEEFSVYKGSDNPFL